MTNPIHFTTAEEAVKVIKSGDHVHLSSVASAPQCLINAMCKRGEAGELKDVHVHHLHTEGPAPYADPKFEGVFQLDSFFVGANVRKVTQSGYADYIPIFLSETQRLYRCGAVPCNVAMIQVCPPDKHGFVSLGTSVDATLAAVECADYVIAVVNKYVPRAFGQAMIHSSKIDFFVQDDTPLIEMIDALNIRYCGPSFGVRRFETGQHIYEIWFYKVNDQLEEIGNISVFENGYIYLGESKYEAVDQERFDELLDFLRSVTTAS